MSNRRSRGSLASPSSTPSAPSFSSPSPTLGADDVSTLSLSEVRERLARNTRVLSTGPFATPQSAPYQALPTPSPVIGSGVPISNANGQRAPRHPTPSAGTSPTDSVRDRLLGVRAQLLARERELVMTQTAEGMGGLQLGGLDVAQAPTAPLVQSATAATGMSGVKAIDDDEGEDEEKEAESSAMAGRRWSHSAPNRPAPIARPAQQSGQGQGGQQLASGKRAAMMNIREREKGYAPNGLILPVSESIALASRDFDHQTASRLSSLSLGPAQYGLDMGGIPRSSSSPKSRRHRILPYPDESPLSAGAGTSNAHGNLQRLRTGEDENARAQALARVNAFMSYKGGGRYGDGGDIGDFDDDDDDDADDDGDVDGGMFDGVDGDGVDAIFDFEEPDYPESSALDGRHRTSGPLGGDVKGKRRERGTGEEVDVYGEDDERFAEGNGDFEEEAGPDAMDTQ